MVVGRGVWTAMIGCAVLAACGGNETGSLSHIDEGAGGVPDAGSSTGGWNTAGGNSTGGRSTGGVRTGGSTPVPEASTGTGGVGHDAAVTDAAPDRPRPHDVYVSPTGNDSAAGTRDAPVQTIARAAAVVTAPHRIVLLAGTFDETTQPSFRGRSARPLLDGVQIPAAVAVVSDEPGAAHLVGSGAGLSFLAGGAVQGIEFQGFLNAITGWGGSLAISGSSFTGCGSELTAAQRYCIEIQGGSATLSAAGVSNYVSPTTKHLLLAAISTEVDVNGGRVAGITEATDGAIFHVFGQLTLTDVTVEDNAQRAILAERGMTILQNVTIQGTRDAAVAAIELKSNSKLAFLNSRLLDNAGAGVVSTPTSSVFEDCEISRNGAEGIAAYSMNVDLTVTNCAIHANRKSGIAAGGQLIVESTTFLGNGEYGILGGIDTDLRVRASRFERNAAGGLFVVRAIDLDAGSLGIVTDPGNNVILGSVGAPGVVVAANAAVNAVGNTWVPNVQGASATGRYTVTGAGATLIDDFGAADVAGANYQLQGVGASIRLAENP